MKHFLTASLFCLVIINSSANAQEFITKGTSLIGGSIGYDQRKSEDLNLNVTTLVNQDIINDFSRFTFAPTYAKAIKDGLMLGGSISITTQESEISVQQVNFTQTDNRSSNTIGFSVFLRRYYEIKGKFGAYIEPRISFSRGSEDRTFDFRDSSNPTFFQEETIEATTTTFGGGANLGLYYFISDRFSLETTLANVLISRSKTNRESESVPNSESSDTDSVLRFQFANTLSFDQILTFNYFF